MSAVGVVLSLLAMAAPSWREELEEVQRAADAARVEPEDRRQAALERVLEAYAELLARHPKNRLLVPMARRRRAQILAGLGRPVEALAEYDAIVAGRARRKDKARALLDGGKILERAGDFHGAEKRLRRVGEEYGDVDGAVAPAELLRGRCLQRMARPREARRVYRALIDDHWLEQAKYAIQAYDALALMEIEAGRKEHARRILSECTRRYENLASRGNKYGKWLGDMLGRMKAPSRLHGE